MSDQIAQCSQCGSINVESITMRDGGTMWLCDDCGSWFHMNEVILIQKPIESGYRSLGTGDLYRKLCDEDTCIADAIAAKSWDELAHVTKMRKVRQYALDKAFSSVCGELVGECSDSERDAELAYRWAEALVKGVDTIEPI